LYRYTEVGLRCSAGIATNKLCAKLVSGLHKPDDQTLLPPCEAADTVAPLPVRALPGVGAVTSVCCLATKVFCFQMLQVCTKLLNSFSLTRSA
jgi:nucleotidyltransferase/DNA polymerase involved in DNA repair